MITEYPHIIKSQKVINPTKKDARIIRNKSIRKIKRNGAFDFKNFIVKKPWGYEYLCGKNKKVEIWELHIKPTSSTSLHCHPQKDTLNIVIQGDIILETLSSRNVLHPGDFRIIKAGLAHKTINKDRVFYSRVLELESPPNKYNLIRIQDDYGREGDGYLQFNKTLLRKKIGVQKYQCLEQNDCRKDIIKRKKFIPENGVGQRMIKIEELIISSKKNVMNKTLQEYTKIFENMFILHGSLVVKDNRKVIKLNPGTYIKNRSIHQFNWSTKKLNMLLW